MGKDSMKKKGKSSSSHMERFPEELEDEIDKFHRHRDVIPLENTGSSDSEDEEMENPVFDLKDEDSNESQDEASMEDDFHSDSYSDEEVTGLTAKMAAQIKLMKRKTMTLDEDDDNDKDEKPKDAWGKCKRIYHGADDMLSSDEEGPAKEEAEARRIQQKLAASLRPEDFEYNESDSEGPEDGELTLQEAAQQNEKEGKGVHGPHSKGELSGLIPIEKIEKDFNAFSKEEQSQVVMSNAPELLGLLGELREAVVEMDSLQPVLKKVQGGQLAAKEGMMYLEVKHMLLLSYCQSIVFYLLLKGEGKSVCDHPVISRLVELRKCLEKMRPIDEKLKDQIKAVLDDKGNILGKESKKSRPDDGEYLTHKMRSVKAGRKRSHLQLPAVTDQVFIGSQSQQMLKEMERLEAQKLSSQTRSVQLQQPKSRLISPFDDYDDDVDTGGSTQEVSKKNSKLSQVISQAGHRPKKAKVFSGDSDLPVKDDLGERRRKHEQQQIDQIRGNGNEPSEVDLKGENIEDQTHPRAKTLKATKKPEKAANVAWKASQPQEDLVEGRRLITSEMEKNRGLTPHRKKANKNPRKKYKVKHEKAVIRRKGQVREIKRQTGSYGGESTGIKANISRSIRFKS